MKNLSTRSRIILLVVLSALPALVLILYNTWDERIRAEAHAREDLSRLVKLAADQQNDVIEGATQTLAAVSMTMPFLERDQARCYAYFSSVLKKAPGLYHTIGIYFANGEKLCDSSPSQGKIHVPPGRPYFELPLATGRFAIGDYQIGQITGKQAVNFGYPVTDSTGKITAVAFAALDLDNFNRKAAATPLPKGGILTVIDRNGTILARHPERSGVVGQKLRSAPVIRNLASGKQGVFEATGTDDVDRLFAFESIAENPDGTIPLRVMISLPLRVVFADADAALARNLVYLIAATVLLIAVAWYGAEMFILRSVRTLLDAARRVQAGRLSARTGLVHGKDELAQLGSAFDDMARALQDREADLNKAMDDLHRQAITDSLTGLYNRRYLYDALPRELARARRKNTPVAILMIDLDYFKRVNDTYGHEAGDLVLKEVAHLIKTTVRSSDYGCRYGGEEISVVLPDAPLEGARLRAEAIRAAVQALEVNCPGGKIVKVTASVGIAVYPEHGSEPDSLLRAADEALYEAKGAGRNRVMISGAAAAGR